MHSICTGALLLAVVYLVPTIISAPTISKDPTSNLGNEGNLALPVLSQPSLPPSINLTLLHKEDGEKYTVPGTLTTLEFYLGFPINAGSLTNTVRSARRYCDYHVDAGSRGPLPWDEDPFIEDLGWGARITIMSARPAHRITWKVLLETMRGLWDYLIQGGHFMEAEFDIMNGGWGLVGRGKIESTEKLPGRGRGSWRNPYE